jgi:short-subunit dehydrogenase
MRLDDRRILLSGATGGLGRTMASRLASDGAVLILSSRSAEELARLAASLEGGADRHRVLVADLAIDGAAEELVREAGELDGMVANAALPSTGRLESFSEMEVQRSLRVNLEAPIRMARSLAPALAERGEGHLVFVASLAGKVSSPRSSLYNATKAGLRGFAFGLREDLLPSGVGVSLVTPGFVRDAGLLHDSGSPPPPGLGTTTPGRVAAAVSRAIRRNRAEIVVAPWRQRAVAELGQRHPALAARVQRRGRADRIAARVASGQTDKR